MNKATLFAIVTFLFIASGPARAVDQDAIDNLTGSLAVQLETMVAGSVEKELRDSGLAETDVRRAVTEFSTQSAKCVVDAIIKQAIDRSMDVDEVIANLDDGLHGSVDVPDEMDEDELERSLEFCVLLALESAGIESPDFVR